VRAVHQLQRLGLDRGAHLQRHRLDLVGVRIGFDEHEMIIGIGVKLGLRKDFVSQPDTPTAPV